MSSTTIWLSFDLGVTGDYEGMYRWLADHSAEECGDRVALVRIDSVQFPNFPDDLMADIAGVVEIDPKKTRIYIVWKGEEKLKGRFIYGQRRQAPWSGYGNVKEQADDF
jgi:hypothetical protein